MRPKRPMPSSDELREQFGVNLRKYRKRLGISQHELAFRSEMALASISLLELGKKQPRIDSLIRLAGALEGRRASWPPASTGCRPKLSPRPAASMSQRTRSSQRRSQRCERQLRVVGSDPSDEQVEGGTGAVI
ncbi:MAG: helix-turn-helix transcriptional regulator [Solirubrobacterales bacterium]|nr:helix-turn-helix transcriptional regulator [Solirubrobacterales bacterium]